MKDEKKFGERSIGERVAIVAVGVVLFAVAVVLLVVLAGLSIRLVEWVWP